MNIEVPLQDLQKKKIMLATPMYGGMCAGLFTKSVMDLSALCAKHNIQLVAYYLFNESLITRARNYACDEFMRSDCTHLMFIDADIGFQPQDVLALAALCTDDSDYDIIGAAYPKKCISWEKIKVAVDKGMADKSPNELENYVGDYVFNPKAGNATIMINEPAEVLEIGTGFMMIQRRVFEKFRDTFPQYHYRPDHVRTAAFDGSREIMQYFQAEIDIYNPVHEYKDIIDRFRIGQIDAEGCNEQLEKISERVTKSSKRYLSEDYWFCQKVQELGMRTWLCPWMRLQHVGTYIFGGSLAHLAQIGTSATADPGQLHGKT